jgi:putative endonuclease
VEDQTNERPTYFVYIARCSNGMLYTDYTKDLKKRIACHNAGKGGRYTRKLRPLVLVVAWAINARRDAMRTERLIKRLPRARKLCLIKSPCELQAMAHE